MLSSQAKQDIMAKLSAKLGYPISEGNLSPDIRRGITVLSNIERYLYVIQEILRAEDGRVKGSVVLSLASKVHAIKTDPKQVEQINKLRTEIEIKINELADRILKDEKEKGSESPHNAYDQRITMIVELKCPRCGAPLPLPTTKVVKCSYCNSTFLIQDLVPQLSSMVRNI